jgi:integrase
MFERGLSARTIEYTNAVLGIRIRQAVRWKMLAEDPCVGVDLPRVKRKEMEALSVEECRSFLEVAAKSEWFPVLALALTTGMRPSEYLALKWTDLLFCPRVHNAKQMISKIDDFQCLQRVVQIYIAVRLRILV